MSKEDPRATFRDPATLEMKYAVGLTESEAIRLKVMVDEAIAGRSLASLDVDPELNGISKSMQWVIDAASADRSKNEVP